MGKSFVIVLELRKSGALGARLRRVYLHITGWAEGLTWPGCLWDSLYLNSSTSFVGWAPSWSQSPCPRGLAHMGMREGLGLSLNRQLMQWPLLERTWKLHRWESAHLGWGVLPVGGVGGWRWLLVAGDGLEFGAGLPPPSGQPPGPPGGAGRKLLWAGGSCVPGPGASPGPGAGQSVAAGASAAPDPQLPVFHADGSSGKVAAATGLVAWPQCQGCSG